MDELLTPGSAVAAWIPDALKRHGGGCLGVHTGSRADSACVRRILLPVADTVLP